MNPKDAYEWLKRHSIETSYLSSLGELTAWDQRTCLPRLGHRHRSEQLALLARMLHERATDPRIGDCLGDVQGTDLTVDPTSPEAVNVREWQRTYDRLTRIPRRLAEALARATSDAVKVLDAAGYDIILVETVGAGQSEVDIAKAAHTTVVVEAPGLGDDVQAIKAGILEIAEVFAVNKADREGVEHTAMALEMMLDLNHASRSTLHHGKLMTVEGPAESVSNIPAWRPPICKTIATRGEGVPALLEAIEAHRTHLEETHTLSLRERARVEDELHDILSRLLMQHLLNRVPPDELTHLVDRITARELDPYTAAEILLQP